MCSPAERQASAAGASRHWRTDRDWAERLDPVRWMLCSASYGLGTTVISKFSLEALLAVWTAAVNTERFEIEPLPTSGARPPALLRYPDNFLNEIAHEEQDGASQPNLLLDESIGGELQRKPPDSKERQD